MKRYLVFAYDLYYPMGALHDLESDYHSLVDALELVEFLKGKTLPPDIIEIYDQQDHKYVLRKTA